MSNVNRIWSSLGVLPFIALFALPQGGCNQPENKDTPKAAPVPETTSATSECKKDTDCKGDRVCENGACRAPAANRRDTTPTPPPQPVVARNDTSIPPPGSPIPEGWEFNQAREVTVTDSSKYHCETKMVREWLRVLCKPYGSNGVTEARFTLTDNVMTQVSPIQNGTVALLTQVVRGKTINADIIWDDRGRSWGKTLVVTWDASSPRPKMYFIEQ